jgi:drug/metabolite transporter (DMT)-like permease
MYSGISAIKIVFFEHLILASIFSVVFFKSLKTIWNAKTSHYFYFFMVGAVGSAWATISFTGAFAFLNPSLVILLQKFQPVVAIFLARIVLKEQIKNTFIFWALICIVGAFLISFNDIKTLAGSDLSKLFSSDSFYGYLLVAFSVLGWGGATVFGKKLGIEGYSDEQIMSGRFLLGFLAILPFVTFSGEIFDHTIEIYGKIALMVLVSGILAMYLFYQGLRRTSARACTLAEMFFPFMAIIVNWVFLNKALEPIQLIGGGILLLGSLVIQLKKY